MMMKGIAKGYNNSNRLLMWIQWIKCIARREIVCDEDPLLAVSLLFYCMKMCEYLERGIDLYKKQKIANEIV